MSGPERHPPGAWYAQTPEMIKAWLERIDNEPPPAPTICGLLYRGQTHDLHGPSDAGKSLLAAAIARNVLDNGGRVLWLDWEQGCDRVLRRMLAFGAAETALIERLHLVDHAHGVPPLEAAGELGADVDLVVVDAFTGLLVSLKLGSISDTDIEGAYIALLRPLAALGSAVLTIDHVKNNPQERNGKAIGSGRKMGAVDVSLDFEAIKPGFKPGHGGRAKIKVSRDRDGGVVPCEFILESDMSWRLEARESGEDWKPTGIMQSVSIYLEAQTEPVSKATIERDVRGNDKYVRQAIDELIRDGHIRTTDGPRNAILCSSVTPYRQPTSVTSVDLGATSVNRGGVTTSVTSVPPLLGEPGCAEVTPALDGDDLGHDDETFIIVGRTEEEQLERLEGMRRLGHHYGYPLCCIEAFVTDVALYRAPGELRGLDPTGRYVPCADCKAAEAGTPAAADDEALEQRAASQDGYYEALS